MSGNPGAGVGAGNAAGVCAGSAGAGNATADDEEDGTATGSDGGAIGPGRHVDSRHSRKCAAGGGVHQFPLFLLVQGVLLQI